jgi:HEAT repeat protein
MGLDIEKRMDRLIHQKDINALADMLGKDAYDSANIPYLVRAPKALGKIGGEAAAAALEAVVRRGKTVYWVMDDAVAELGNLGMERSVPAICKALEKDHTGQFDWSICAVALGKIGGQAALDGLIQSFKQPRHAKACVATIKSLGKIGGQRAAEAVLAQLNHEEKDVRNAAVSEIYNIGHEAPTRMLTDALRNASEATIRAIACALEKKRDVSAVPSLKQKLVHTKRTRKQVAHTLAELGAPKYESVILGESEDLDRLIEMEGRETLVEWIRAEQRIIEAALSHWFDEEVMLSTELMMVSPAKGRSTMLWFFAKAEGELRKDAADRLKAVGETIWSEIFSGNEHDFARFARAQAQGQVTRPDLIFIFNRSEYRTRHQLAACLMAEGASDVKGALRKAKVPILFYDDNYDDDEEDTFSDLRESDFSVY